MTLALEGIKVLDVAQVVAVPMGARHLADFGAEVIKVEPPVGDSWRGVLTGAGANSSVASDIDYNWETYNRNKKSLALDLSQRDGQKILYKLVERADVIVTNLRLWEREKFRVDYDILRQINPRLIYGSITGYGKKGPDKDAPAYDTTAAWFRAGIPHMLSYTGMPGVGFRPAFVDVMAGVALFAGIMTSLYVREKTGVGQEVELSLFNMGIYHLSFDIAGALVTGKDIKDPIPPSNEEEAQLLKRRQELEAEAQVAVDRLFDFHRENMPNPLGMPYKTKDGRIVHLNVLQPDRYWSRMCQVLERPDLEHDPRFESHEPRTENHAALYRIMKEAFQNRTLEEWRQRLSEAAIPHAPRQKLSEVISDPQAEANDYFPDFDHPTYGRIKVVANPIRLSETPSSIRLPAPEFSQHTEEILLELGYSWENIAQFKERGIIP